MGCEVNIGIDLSLGRESGAPGELPSLGVHLDFLASLDEEGNSYLDARLKFRDFGDGSARRIAADTRFGVGDGQLHLDGKLQPDGIAVVLVDFEAKRLREENPGHLRPCPGSANESQSFPGRENRSHRNRYRDRTREQSADLVP